jgi:molybdopterin biosynthesis enzyme MoaB
MDGGAGRFDIAVVEARKFLSAEIEGMSKLVEKKSMLAEGSKIKGSRRTFGVTDGGKLERRN